MVRCVIFALMIPFAPLARGTPPLAPELLDVKACKRGHYKVANPVQTRNTPEPQFDLGKRADYFDREPVTDQEKAVLELIGIDLYPAKGTFDASRPGEALDKWIGEVDVFLDAHKDDPAVVELVKRYVSYFANHPVSGYHSGDWEIKREFATWIEFFEVPWHYDQKGEVLKIDGKPVATQAPADLFGDPVKYPVTEFPEKLSPDEYRRAFKMHTIVFRSIAGPYEGFGQMIREGAYASEDKALPQIAYVRRLHLQQKLLKMGQQMWKTETNRN